MGFSELKRAIQAMGFGTDLAKLRGEQAKLSSNLANGSDFRQALEEKSSVDSCKKVAEIIYKSLGVGLNWVPTSEEVKKLYILMARKKKMIEARIKLKELIQERRRWLKELEEQNKKPRLRASEAGPSGISPEVDSEIDYKNLERAVEKEEFEKKAQDEYEIQKLEKEIKKKAKADLINESKPRKTAEDEAQEALAAMQVELDTEAVRSSAAHAAAPEPAAAPAAALAPAPAVVQRIVPQPPPLVSPRQASLPEEAIRNNVQVLLNIHDVREREQIIRRFNSINEQYRTEQVAEALYDYRDKPEELNTIVLIANCGVSDYEIRTPGLIEAVTEFKAKAIANRRPRSSLADIDENVDYFLAVLTGSGGNTDNFLSRRVHLFRQVLSQFDVIDIKQFNRLRVTRDFLGCLYGVNGSEITGYRVKAAALLIKKPGLNEEIMRGLVQVNSLDELKVLTVLMNHFTSDDLDFRMPIAQIPAQAFGKFLMECIPDLAVCAPGQDLEKIIQALCQNTGQPSDKVVLFSFFRFINQESRTLEVAEALIALANEGVKTREGFSKLLDITVRIQAESPPHSFEDAAIIVVQTCQARFDLILALNNLLDVDPHQVTRANISTILLTLVANPEPRLQDLYARIVCKLFQANKPVLFVEDMLTRICKAEENRLGLNVDEVIESAQTLLFLIDKLPLNYINNDDFLNEFRSFGGSAGVDSIAFKHLRETLFKEVNKQDAVFLFEQFLSVQDDAKRNTVFAFRLNSHLRNPRDPHPRDTCRMIAYSIQNDKGWNDNQCAQIAAHLALIKDDPSKTPHVLTCLVDRAGDPVQIQVVIALVNQGISEETSLTPELIALVRRMHDKGVTVDDAAEIVRQVSGGPNRQNVLNDLINSLSVDWLKPQYVTAQLVKELAKPGPASQLFHAGSVQEQEETKRHIDKAAELVQAMYAKGFPPSFIEDFPFSSYDLPALIGLKYIINELDLQQLAKLLKWTTMGVALGLLKDLFSYIYAEDSAKEPDGPVMEAKARVLRACLEKEVPLTEIKDLIWAPNARVDAIEHYTTLAFMIRHLPISACTGPNLKILMEVAGNTPQERQRVRTLLFSGVEEDRCVTILAEFAELAQAYRTQSAALRIKESIHEDQLSEEQGYKLYFIRKAIKRPKSYLNEAKCSELAKAVMQIDKEKRRAPYKKASLALFKQVAHDGGESQKIALTVKLVNELADVPHFDEVKLAYAMMQKGVDMDTAVRMVVLYSSEQVQLKAVVKHLAYGANVSLITQDLLQAVQGRDADNKAQVLAALISRKPNPLTREQHLREMVALARGLNQAAVLKVLANHLDGADLYAFSQEHGFNNLLRKLKQPEIVLNILLKNMSSSQEKRSLLEVFIQVDHDRNLTVDVARALNRERHDPSRLNQVLWMSQVVPAGAWKVLADDVSSEKLAVLKDFKESEVKGIRDNFLCLYKDNRTIEVLKALSRYPENKDQRDIVTKLAAAGVTTGCGLDPEIIDFLSEPQFIGINGVVAIPNELLSSFGAITPPENCTLNVLQTLSRHSGEDCSVIARLASGDQPDYSTQAIKRFKEDKPGLPALLNEKVNAILAKTLRTRHKLHMA